MRSKTIFRGAATALITPLTEQGIDYEAFMRWGKAQEVLNGTRVHGVKISPDIYGNFSYERIEADTQDRQFPAKYNIFPIPYSELQNNRLCVQNDAWL